MTHITETYRNDEGSFEFVGYNAYEGDVEIGTATLMVDSASTYVERIDIYDGHRGQGHGTEFLKALAGAHGGEILVSPDNEDAKRLYDRIGYEVSGDSVNAVYDQGYGVYEIRD